MFKCGYCPEYTDKWHSCPGAVRAKAQLDSILEQIHADQKRHNSTPETSMQIRNRSNQTRNIATTVKMSGAVKNEYR